MPASPHEAAVGVLLREWRLLRRRSQPDLSIEAGISARHLSFLETGRSRPSPDMVERLCKHLDIPLRERNTLLLAAGFAPQHPERSLDDAAMGPVREALDLVLHGHDPYPAAVVDRHWNLLSAKASLAVLIEGVALTGDPVLARLLEEVRSYPDPASERWRGTERAEDRAARADNRIAVPLRLRSGTQDWPSTARSRPSAQRSRSQPRSCRSSPSSRLTRLPQLSSGLTLSGKSTGLLPDCIVAVTTTTSRGEPTCPHFCLPHPAVIGHRPCLPR